MNALSREDFSELTKTLRPRLRRELRFVPEEISNWADRDFIAVTNRSKSEGVLVFDDRRVAAFQLQSRKPNPAGQLVAIICDFCATWQRGTNSAIITFAKEKSTQSFLVCGDLNCSLHVRDKTPEAKLSRVQLRENNTVQERIERMKAKLKTTFDY